MADSTKSLLRSVVTYGPPDSNVVMFSRFRLQTVTAGKLRFLSLVSVIEVAIGSSCTSRMMLLIVTAQNPLMAITRITPQNMHLSHDLLVKMYRAPLNVESLKNFSALLFHAAWLDGFFSLLIVKCLCPFAHSSD